MPWPQSFETCCPARARVTGCGGMALPRGVAIELWPLATSSPSGGNRVRAQVREPSLAKATTGFLPHRLRPSLVVPRACHLSLPIRRSSNLTPDSAPTGDCLSPSIRNSECRLIEVGPDDKHRSRGCVSFGLDLQRASCVGDPQVPVALWASLRPPASFGVQRQTKRLGRLHNHRSPDRALYFATSWLSRALQRSA